MLVIRLNRTSKEVLYTYIYINIKYIHFSMWVGILEGFSSATVILTTVANPHTPTHPSQRLPPLCEGRGGQPSHPPTPAGLRRTQICLNTLLSVTRWRLD